MGRPKRSSRPDQIPFPRDGDADVLDAEWAERWAGRLVDKLRQDLHDDPGAYELRRSMVAMGRRFVLAYAGFRERPGVRPDPEVIGEFVIRVVSPGTTVVEAVGRRAAVRAAERLFVEAGNELFCLIYRQFLADIVTEFLRAVIAEQLNSAFPGLALVDPGGYIADAVAERLVRLVPDPCAGAVPGHSPLEIAIEQLPAAVDVVLGLQEPE
jgi:hypothetical protein